MGVQFLGQEDILEKETATHSSILAGEILLTERGACRATVHRTTRVWHDLETNNKSLPLVFIKYFNLLLPLVSVHMQLYVTLTKWPCFVWGEPYTNKQSDYTYNKRTSSIIWKINYHLNNLCVCLCLFYHLAFISSNLFYFDLQNTVKQENALTFPWFYL